MSDALTTENFWDQRWRKSEPGSFRRSLRASEGAIRQELNTFLGKRSAETRLLEVGGAPGDMIRCQHEANPDIQIDCLDYSPVGVKKVRHVYAKHNIRGEIHLGDLRTWSPSHEGYDIVTSFGVIEHFEDTIEAIAHHVRLCKPGGSLFVTIPNYSAFPVQQLLKRFSSDTLVNHNLWCMSEKNLETSFRKLKVPDFTIRLFGPPLLPHSQYNHSVTGKTYHFAAKAWNATVAIASLAFQHRSKLAMWGNSYLIKATKPTEASYLSPEHPLNTDAA